MQVSIREYQSSDFTTCCSLWEELTEQHRRIYEDPDIGPGDSGVYFKAYLNRPERRGAWVLQVDNKTVAFSGLLQSIEEGIGEIEPVIVSSDCRRRGFGKLIVQYVIQEARRMGIRFLCVKPVMRNRDAILFFIKMGFGIVGDINLFQELSPSDRRWQSGIVIHGKKLDY